MKHLLRRILPRPLRRAIAAGVYPLLIAADAARDGPLVPPSALITVGGGDFVEMGNQFLGYFREIGGLDPDDRVLDVGCGIGRMAVPLTRYLSNAGSYEGFDVVPHGIAWCQRRITPRFPNFRFRSVSVRNDDYNPNGSIRAATFEFPYPDASFDFVLLTSVFTHMTPDGVENYLREIARVLRPGGRCFSTWFLLNDESRALLARGKAALDFRHALGDCLTTNSAIPEEAIAFDEARIRARFGSLKMTVDEPIRYGHWSGRAQFLSYQDICVARKPA